LQRRQIGEYVASLRTDAKVDITRPAEVSPKQTPSPVDPGGKPEIMMNNY
jgi:hypothetical protein